MTSGFFVGTAVRRVDFQLTEAIGLRWLESSETSRRGFCSDCGSSLFFDHGADEPIGISAGSFDHEITQAPQVHIYTDEAMPGLLPDDNCIAMTAKEWADGGWKRVRDG